MNCFFFFKGSKSKFFFLGGGRGVGSVGGRTDEQGQTNLPLNFFQVGCIMHKSTSYGPDKIYL